MGTAVPGQDAGGEILLSVHALAAGTSGLCTDQHSFGACCRPAAYGSVGPDFSGNLPGRSRLRVARRCSLMVLRWADELSFQESLSFLGLRKFDSKGLFLVMPVVFVA